MALAGCDRGRSLPAAASSLLFMVEICEAGLQHVFGLGGHFSWQASGNSHFGLKSTWQVTWQWSHGLIVCTQIRETPQRPHMCALARALQTIYIVATAK